MGRPGRKELKAQEEARPALRKAKEEKRALQLEVSPMTHSLQTIQSWKLALGS